MRLRLFFIFLISMGFAFGANAQKTISRSATSTLPAGDLKKVENKPVQTNPQDTSTTQATSNDSIAAYYDFKTTNFMRERDLFFFGDSGQVLDTTLYPRYRYNEVQRNENLYQNLGNIGTAMHPIYYKTPDQIGTRWGITVYDPHKVGVQDVRYFNSQSPFTNLYLVQGGQGKTDLVVEFARNINPEWNVELFYNRKAANRVVGDNFSRNDVMLTHQVFGAATRFFTPKRRYKLLAHFLYYQFDNKEQGGLFSTELSRQNMDSLFIASEGSLTERLTDATIRQDGRRLRLYHEYAIAPKNFAIFHSFSLEREANRFRDEAYTSNPQYYDTLYYLTPTEITSVSYRSQFRTLENIGGIKARAGDFQLRGYAKYRNYQYSTTSLQDSIPQDTVVARDLPSELFVGGQLRLRLDSQRSIGGFAEYLIAGGYKFGGKLRFRDFEARYQRTSYAPSLAEQDRRFGNHYRWDNRDFKNTILDDVEGSYTYQHEKDSLWGFTVTPFGRFRNFQRLVFFDQNSLAAQDSTSFQMANLGFRGKLRYKYWRTNMLFMFSESFDRNTIRVPQFFLNWSIYYERELFNGVMPAQLGIDIHWKSRFKGNQYNVAIQQFHLQDQNLIANYVYADLFWNFRVNRVFLFLKVNNVLQGAFAENYFETPFYFGQPRSFEFGFQWRFFD